MQKKLELELKETETRPAQQKKVHKTSVALVVFQSLSTIYELHVTFSVALVVFQSLSTMYESYVPFSVVLVVFQFQSGSLEPLSGFLLEYMENLL
jgi:hypothetical protein